MRRGLLLLVLVALLPIPVGAQQYRSEKGSFSAASVDGVSIDTRGMSTVSVHVTGTYTGLGVAFEVTNNPADGWDATYCMTQTIPSTYGASATANGMWICPISGIARFKARVGAVATGTVSLRLGASATPMSPVFPQPVSASQNGSWSADVVATNTISALVENFGPNFVCGQGNCFSANTAAFTPPATPTDNCLIGGSATATIKVVDARISGTATGAETREWFLVKRGAANTVGTFVAATVVPHNSENTSVAPTVGHYTANPTINSTIGILSHRRVLLALNTTLAIAEANVSLMPPGGAIELNGVAEQLAINFAGAALPAGSSWKCHFSWLEE